MDAALTIARLSEEFNALCESYDFEGAEELLTGSLEQLPPKFKPYIHFQFGRLYLRWNKMSSAINHLNRAAELSQIGRDEIFVQQVVEELRRARKLQLEQMP